MTKAQEYYERVKALTSDGSMSGQDAFKIVAKEFKASAATVQTGYYRAKRAAEGTTKRKGKRAARTTVALATAAPRQRTMPSNGNRSELDMHIDNLVAAAEALRAYSKRDHKVRELTALLVG